MGPGEHRPHDDEYWVERWSSVLFSGDLFEAIPFSDQPTEIAEDSDSDPAKHYLGEIVWGYGLLISPTCDMIIQGSHPPQQAHPFRALVPVVPLSEVTEQVPTVQENLNLLRSRDALHPYMYLPPIEEGEEEAVACLFRPTVVSDDFLRNPPRRIAQLHPEARRQLKAKLARYWGRADVHRNELRLREENEDELVADGPTPYDAVVD